MPRFIKYMGILMLPVLLALGYTFLAQTLLSHADAAFTPDYPKLSLTEDMEEEEMFRQTGLSPAAVKQVLLDSGAEGLQTYQDAFFADKEMECRDILGFIVRQDSLTQGTAPIFADPEAGDLVVSLSPHSAGWRHGHAAVILNDFALVQLTQYGTRSDVYYFSSILDLSQYAVLRLKDRPTDFPQKILDYTLENLIGVPYRLLGPKAPELENLALMCTSLAWYPYYSLGYDVDSDGGWFVSGQDILDSPLLEVVQIYGMDPALFLHRMAR